MTNGVDLISLATAVPQHALVQAEVADAAQAVFGRRMHGYDRLARVFESAGIECRYGIRPKDWYLEERGWHERTAAYTAGATDLLVTVANRALAKAGLAGADVDTVVLVSSTGIATPSLEARIAPSVGFRPDVRRVPVFGLGCAGGVTGLALASRLAAVPAGGTALLLVVEICTLAFRLDQLTKANIVATALFGDGAAACVLRAGDKGAGGGGSGGHPVLARVTGSGEHLWPNTLDIMGWRVDDQGFGVIFDRSIPPFVEEHAAAAVDAIFSQAGTDRGAVGRILCHPGGAKVVESIEHALALGAGSLDHERTVLRDFGNMSAATVLFVLERALQAGLPHRSALFALGPGFTASGVTLAGPQ